MKAIGRAASKAELKKTMVVVERGVFINLLNDHLCESTVIAVQ